MAFTILTLLAGGLLLMVGATALVQGAASLALRLGMTPLLIGLTVVAFGTSAPELSVSMEAALNGSGGIAVGNVVGSNIVNVGLILALAALIKPIATERSAFKRDLPLMVGASLLGALLLLDGTVGRIEGVCLVALLVAYVFWSVRASRSEESEEDIPTGSKPAGALRNALFVIAGLIGLIAGAGWFVDAAVVLAEAAGVSNAVIGLTVVALGTSLPELATSTVAALKGESAIAVGNVLGSNLFNLLGVLGAAALASPITAPGLRWADVIVMVAFAAVLIPMMWSGSRLGRWEAAVLLAGYSAYIAFLAASPG